MRKFFRWLRKWVVRFTLFFFALTVGWVLLYKWVNPPTTCLQLYHGKEGVHEWKSLHELGYQLPLAVIASEDQRFLKHNGFDRAAISAAVEYNRTHERKIGASTISQQTAKNVFLWPSRSWLRKGLEAYFTVLIEIMWSKERIIEVYLNVIEMGPKCFGAEAASQRYFKRPAKKMSSYQAAMIAASLPHPRKSNPGKPSSYLQKRAGQIERQMKNLGGIYSLPWVASGKEG